MSSPVKTLTAAGLLTAGVVIYLVLLAGRAVALLRSGEPLAIALGVGVLILPVLGAWMVVSTWLSGMRIERLRKRLAAEGALPDTDGLPRRPSGRVDRAAADAYFAERKQELDAAPDDWRAWYRVAYAYDVAGDRRRARAAMRQAVALEADSVEPGEEHRR